MIRLGTKADTLEALRGVLALSRICPSAVFLVSEWESARTDVLNRVHVLFGNATLIVRSSALGEDTAIASMAGAYDSVANVPGDQRDALASAIDRVVASYGKAAIPHRRPSSEMHQVLVQPMVTDVSMSGVVFTQDLNSGGPYYVINYDDESGQTDTVTSGRADVSRTLLVHRRHVDSLGSPRFGSLLRAILEIEDVVRLPGLDIEFSVTNGGDIYIFQVRPLAIQENWNRDVASNCDLALKEIQAFLESSFRPQPGLLGKRAIFTEMSDWNPAEMIGPVPRRLAWSLYRLLITDGIWARARAAMGYRDIGEPPLMVSLGGRAYIDVRKSFNSFLPGGLTDGICEKLVDLWLDRLAANPELHDKVEFDVATTVYPLDYEERTRPELLRAGWRAGEIDEFGQSLIDLTNKIVGSQADLPAREMAGVRQLRDYWNELSVSADAGADPRQIPARVALLLRHCRLLGTMPFAILARCAFVAEDLLRGLVRLRLLSGAEASAFRGSVRTILSDFLVALHDYCDGGLSREAFYREYGHLRPGTYDITSLRFDQRDGLLRPDVKRAPSALQKEQPFGLSHDSRQRIDAALQSRGLAFDAERMFDFMRQAITGREYAKLQFTRNLSDALELLAQWGTSIGLSREELSHIDIGDVLATQVETPDAAYEEHFRTIAKRNRARHTVSSAVRLPFLIGKASDIYVVPLLKSRPNFVTDKKVMGRVVLLTGQELVEPDLEDKIVMIEGADPGYDWIFARGMKGLITKFGGANSHMAIRCAELGIPAAIGCGEQLFDRIVACSDVTIDCPCSQLVPGS